MAYAAAIAENGNMPVEQHRALSTRIRAPSHRERTLLSRSAMSRGFTLTELTIVLVIVALLVGGMLLPCPHKETFKASRKRKSG